MPHASMWPNSLRIPCALRRRLCAISRLAFSLSSSAPLLHYPRRFKMRGHLGAWAESPWPITEKECRAFCGHVTVPYRIKCLRLIQRILIPFFSKSPRTRPSTRRRVTAMKVLTCHCDDNHYICFSEKQTKTLTVTETESVTVTVTVTVTELIRRGARNWNCHRRSVRNILFLAGA